jgi:hypothetical protein
MLANCALYNAVVCGVKKKDQEFCTLDFQKWPTSKQNQREICLDMMRFEFEHEFLIRLG